MQEKLDASNFLLYAAKHYDNPQCFDTLEFYEDLKRFKYIKRLINRYVDEGDLKERLILNHIVVLINLFGVNPTIRMLFYKCEGLERYILPFLSFLNSAPERVEAIGIDCRTINTLEVESDEKIIEALRRI